MNAIGQLFSANVKIDIGALLPPVTFPITTPVPFISPLIEWQHSDDWGPSREIFSTSNAGGLKFDIDLEDEKMSYLKGHKIDGKTIFPATGNLAHF